MSGKEIFEKGMLSIVGAWISNKLGILLPAIGMLIILMIIDYISGMLASKKEAFENVADNSGWNSRCSILGIYKKMGYMLTVLVAISIDYIIYKFAEEMGVNYGTSTIFGLLVTVWFIINELISILENIGRMGTELPDFLKKVLTELKKKIREKDLK